VQIKDTITNEQIALDKARKLAEMEEADRQKAQQDLANLTGEEQEAKRQIWELERQHDCQNPVEIGMEPAVLDTYSHTRQEVGMSPELLNKAAHVEQNTEVKRCCEGEEPKGIVGSIASGIKNLLG